MSTTAPHPPTPAKHTFDGTQSLPTPDPSTPGGNPAAPIDSTDTRAIWCSRQQPAWPTVGISSIGWEYLTVIGHRKDALDETHQGTLHDSPTLKPEGRPRTQRLIGALEGHARGIGDRKRPSTSHWALARRFCRFGEQVKTGHLNFLEGMCTEDICLARTGEADTSCNVGV